MTLREKIGQMCQYCAVWKKGQPSGLDDLTFKLEHADAKEYARKLGKRASLIRKGEIGSFLKAPGGQAVNDQFSSVVTPIRELKAFRRVSLKPGETKTITLTLGPAALSLINAELRRVVEPGKFDIMVADQKRVLEVVK